MKNKLPQFANYACTGDSITWTKDGFDITATLMHDEHSKPSDSDSYSKKVTAAWENDQWFFVGVVISVSRNGVEIDDHAASLWGIECNYPKKGSNKYLAEVALELESEAIESAKKSSEKMILALTS